jgi:NAD(P)-dependent dehydrogenase (short-subunit alcohol dehydrogenase family)
VNLRGHSPADLVDAVIEAPVVTSFTKIGPFIRRRLDHWRSLDSYDLTGRSVLVTGATSGLGKHTASRLAGLGAHVIVNGRDPHKTERVVESLQRSNPNARFDVAIADLGELDQVRDLAARVEITVASQVLGPFLLTDLLLPALSANQPGRVITVTSGGMYAAPLSVGELQMSPEDYGGSDQYARAKRAQVTLNEMWADRVPPSDVVFHTMHPGWADTPGVQTSLPRFRTIMGPLLRDLEDGADTIVWLAADDTAERSSGDLWLDRRQRSIHKLPNTRRSDTPERRARLWDWVADQTDSAT